MTKSITNPIDEAHETVATEQKEDKPAKSIRLSQETRTALAEAKYRTGAPSMDALMQSLLDGSAIVKLLATDFPERAEEVRQMGMLGLKMLELFKLSWSLSSDTEARVTQEMQAIIAEKDNTIATLKAQLEEETATHAEMQDHIKELETEVNLTRRERDAALMRLEETARVDKLAELIESLQARANAAGVTEDAKTNTEGIENEDAQEQFSMWGDHSNVEPPF